MLLSDDFKKIPYEKKKTRLPKQSGFKSHSLAAFLKRPQAEIKSAQLNEGYSFRAVLSIAAPLFQQLN